MPTTINPEKPPKIQFLKREIFQSNNVLNFYVKPFFVIHSISYLLRVDMDRMCSFNSKNYSYQK